MNLNVGDLLKAPGAKTSFDFILEELDDMDDVVIIEPVRVQGDIVNIGGRLELSAQVQTKIEISCSRCLEPFAVPFEFSFQEIYSQAPENEQELEAQEEDVFYYHDDSLSLIQAVRDNLLLNLPMRILCSETCPGLCPICGKNLKAGDCQCQKAEGDPRLALLAQLKMDR